MSIDDDDRTGGGTQSGRPHTVRRITVVAVGAAAVLGVAAYAITVHVEDERSAAGQMTGAVTPAVEFGPPTPSASSATPSGSAAASPAGQATAAAVPDPTLSPQSISPKVRKEIDDARADAARHGHPLRRALVPKGATVPDSLVHTRIARTADATIRITTAKADLAGQGDQLLAADDGRRFGDATCTKKIHFSSGSAPREIPSTILCWRTSASRSVVTLAVAQHGKAIAEESVTVIDAEWAKLG